MKNKQWTLCIDESGRFEGARISGETTETTALVLGGVLCPGTADDWGDQLGRERSPPTGFACGQGSAARLECVHPSATQCI